MTGYDPYFDYCEPSERPSLHEQPKPVAPASEDPIAELARLADNGGAAEGHAWWTVADMRARSVALPEPFRTFFERCSSGFARAFLELHRRER